MSGGPDRARLSAVELLAILVLGAVPRVALLLARGPLAWPDDDNRIYHALASGLLDGHALPLRWPPLLPLLDAAVSAMTTRSVLVPELIVLAFGCAIPPLTALLAAAWSGRRAGLLAGAIAALHGFLVASACSAMTEPIHAALLAAALVILATSRNARGSAWSGALLGLASLARPTGVVLTAAIVLTLASLRAGKRAAIVAACALAVLAPWGAYNARVHGAFRVTTTATGTTLLGSNCRAVLDAGEGWIPAERCGVLSADEIAGLRGGDEAEGDRVLTRAALRDLASDPPRWPRLLVHKAAGMLSLPEARRAPSAFARLSAWAFLALLPFAIGGAVVAWRSDPTGAAPALACIAATIALSLVFWGGTRMRQPVEPELVALSGIGLAAVLQRKVLSRRLRS